MYVTGPTARLGKIAYVRRALEMLRRAIDITTSRKLSTTLAQWGLLMRHLFCSRATQFFA